MMRHCDTYNQMYNHELDLTSSLTRKNLAYVYGIEKNEYQTKLKKRIMNNSKKKTKNDEYSRSHYSASTIDEVPFS